MLARDVMTPKLVTVRVDMSLPEAARTLSNARVSGAPVVDAAGRMVGMLSQTDLVREMSRSLPPGSQPPSPEATQVREVMTPAVFSAEEDFAVEHLGRMMLQKKMHRIVITRDGRPVGIVTPFDLLKALLPAHGPA